jgi:hypothetical protein
MANRGSGFGFVMLLVVLVVVLILATRAWEKVTPTAAEVAEPASPLGPISDHGQTEAAGEVRRLPGLNEMRQNTDQHAQQVEETLAETE